jgi:hypothetical protein
MVGRLRIGGRIESGIAADIVRRRLEIPPLGATTPSLLYMRHRK